jgi:hypothetical protein
LLVKACIVINHAHQIALSRYPYLVIFGPDYPMPNGAGVRDYSPASRPPIAGDEPDLIESGLN